MSIYFLCYLIRFHEKGLDHLGSKSFFEVHVIDTSTACVMTQTRQVFVTWIDRKVSKCELQDEVFGIARKLSKSCDEVHL